MERLQIKTDSEPKIVIENATSDLRIKGWSSREIRADAEGKKSVSYQEDGGTHHIKCMRDCYLRLPSDALLEIVNISGEAFIKAVEGPIQIGTVASGLALKETGAVKIEHVGGDFSGKQLDGDVSINKIAGHAQVRDIGGKLIIEAVGGNFVLRGEAQGFDVKTAGDANVKFEPDPGVSYQVEAAGSIFCRIPEDSQAIIRMESKGQIIRVQTEEMKEEIKEENFELTLGDGSTTIDLKANGSLHLSTYAYTASESFEFDFDFGQDFTGIADEITQQVSEQLEAQMEALNEQMSHLALGLDAKHMERARSEAEKAQRRVEAAQRRLERRMARAQRKAVQRAKITHRHRGAEYADVLAIMGKNEPNEPVGDDERRMVLEMVQENKISVEDAEKLLAAMEGRLPEESTGGEQLAVEGEKFEKSSKKKGEQKA